MAIANDHRASPLPCAPCMGEAHIICWRESFVGQHLQPTVLEVFSGENTSFFVWIYGAKASYPVSPNNSRPMSQRRISDVPAPIS